MKLPGLVAKMCGIEIEEYISMPVDHDNDVQFALPEIEDHFSTTALADVLEPKGADVIAWHTQDFYANKPAATINRFGQGRVIYLGIMGDGAYYDAIARWLSNLADIKPLLETPAGIEVMERWQGEQKIMFILNHTAQPQTITLKSRFTNLLTDQTITGAIQLEPLGVLILTP
jgi:beta-galactosidase